MYKIINFIDSNNILYLIIDSLINISNVTSGSNSITLRKVYGKQVDLIKCI